MEWGMKSEQGWSDCSDAWAAISAFSASTSPEGHSGGDWAAETLKEIKEGYRKRVSDRQRHSSYLFTWQWKYIMVS